MFFQHGFFFLFQKTLGYKMKILRISHGIILENKKRDYNTILLKICGKKVIILHLVQNLEGIT